MGAVGAESRVARVASKCAAIMAAGPVFLDTETTGLGATDQIVDLAVVDRYGQVLLDTLVKPTVPLPPEVTAVNGITPEMLEGAPSFPDIAGKLAELASGRQVITYGAGFDVKMIRQTATAWGLPSPVQSAFCAMIAYAEFYGKKGSWGDWKWQKLEAAARQCAIQMPDNLHRALADTQLLRRVFLHMVSRDPGRKR